MSNIWITSDTHYGHKNIVRGVTNWIQSENPYDENRTRDFDTLEEHNEQLVKNFNNCIAEDDELYHLGDWSFGGFDNIMKFRKQLNCKNIHLILGNHDHHIERNREGIRGAFKSVQHYKELIVDNEYIIMSHFAMRVWNKSHKGSIMLYGHSHGTLPGFGKSMDVGVDTNNLFPYRLDNIIKLMQNKETIIVDHHNKNTN